MPTFEKFVQWVETTLGKGGGLVITLVATAVVIFCIIKAVGSLKNYDFKRAVMPILAGVLALVIAVGGVVVITKMGTELGTEVEAFGQSLAIIPMAGYYIINKIKIKS